MLVLSRKVGERIFVGNSIVITVVRIGPNAVRLGIQAPENLDIVRDELTQPTVNDPLGVAEAYEDESGVAHV